MRNDQLEAKVLDIVDRVTKGQRIEDDAIELKTIWPDEHRKTARQIAGHANSASGQPVLWVIGIDEKRNAVPGVNPAEYSEWWNQVRRCFSELEPDVQFLNVPANGVVVVALLFQTDRAPYVVNAEAGGQITREVPYRFATGLQSATRQQLLTILSREVSRPKLEIVQGKLAADKPSEMGGIGETFTTQFQATLIIYQPQLQETFLVSHKSELYVANDDGERWGLGMVRFVSEERTHCALTGAQKLKVFGECRSDGLSFIRGDRGILHLHLKFWVDVLDDAITVTAKMDEVTGEPHQATWLMKSWRYPW